MTFEKLTLSLPEHWLPAIVNGDTTGFDDAEDAAFGRWLCDTLRELGEFHIGEYEEETHFARYHDAAEYGVLACMCVNTTLMFRPVDCVDG